MENLEAIVIKKTVYGEADYLVTFFTKDMGKVRGSKILVVPGISTALQF